MENEFTQDVTTEPVTLPEDTVIQAKKHFSKLGLMYIIGTIIVLGLQFVSSAIAGAINPELLSSTSYALLITMIPMYAISMPVMGFLISRVPAKQIVKKKMSVGQWLIAFLMCYGGMYVSNLIGLFLTQTIGLIKGSPVTNGILEIATSSNIWVNFLIMVICAPIAEELLFRKLLIDRTVQYGEAVAVLFSGLMFGLFHGNLNQFVYAFTLGICFGFIYVKTGNVRYSIYLHMVINFMGSVLGMLVLKFVGDEFINALSDPAALMPYMMEHMGTVMLYFVYAFFLIALAITGIVLFIVNAKKVHFLSGEVTIPKGKRFSTTILNVGMGLYFIFWIIMIIVQLFS